jgi:hypothetical protein
MSVMPSNRKTDLVQKAMKKAMMSSPSGEKMNQSHQEKTPLRLLLGGGKYAELTECSLVSWCCNLVCHWLVSLHSDWLIGQKWRLLIGQISWLLIG